MEKHDYLNEDMRKEYKSLLDNLSKQYIDGKIDFRTLENKYGKLKHYIAEKCGISIPPPLTLEYIELDDYGKKEIENSIGRIFPRTALESIFEDCSSTEPGILIDKSWLTYIKKELKRMDKTKF